MTDEIKIYYMCDNHTFIPLPLDVDKAELLIREAFDYGQTYGMLCSKHPEIPKNLHAKGRDNAIEFFKDARVWLQHAIDLQNEIFVIGMMP